MSGISELHVLSNASSAAYDAMAYRRWPTSSRPSVRLAYTKVRNTPLKQTTVPRLEMMAALIDFRLTNSIVDELKEKPTVTLWSESQIVHWVQSNSITLKAFVIP